MGRIIELIFTRVYLAMLATGIFWALTFCGGILFGFGPASATIMSLYAEHGSDYKQYAWSEAWSLYKENFRPANQVFYTFFLIEAILVYGMYLMIQLPNQTIIHLAATFLNIFLVALVFLGYAVSLKLQVYFELSYKNTLKLAFIGIFMSLSAMAKVLLGSVLLIIIGFYMPALIAFVGIGMWHFFISDLLEPVYESIHEKLATK